MNTPNMRDNVTKAQNRINQGSDDVSLQIVWNKVPRMPNSILFYSILRPLYLVIIVRFKCHMMVENDAQILNRRTAINLTTDTYKQFQ